MIKKIVNVISLLFLLPATLVSQEITLRGKVVSAENNEVLAGITITVKGTTLGTSSDINGSYYLNKVPKNATLVFSFIGMRTQEIKVEGRTTINVRMEGESIGLKEVVAVGYGVQKKESVVGAISQTTSKELMRTGNVTDLKQALGGQIPGLVTITSSGEPGGTGKGTSATDIFIRGQNTWNGGQPLILVDGVERDMSNVEVNEVSSISVLKDASATAVFGVKGANGVILITTKRGEKEKPRISFSYNATAKSLSKVPEKMESYDAIMARDEAIERETPLNEGSWLDYIPYEIALKYKNPQTPEEAEIYPNVDWEKAMFKDVGFTHKATLNISAGNEIVRYFGSLSYLREGDMFKDYENDKGYDPNYNFDRFNFRNNLDIQITKSTAFKINLSGYYSQKNTNYNTDGKDDLMWAAIYSMPPDIYQPRYSDGRWGWSDARYNPVAVIYNMGVRQIRRTQLYSDFELNQKLDFLTKGLSANASLHYDNDVLSEGGLYDSSNSVWPYFTTSNTAFKVINSNLYTGPGQDPSEYTTLLPTIGEDQYDWYLKPWTITQETMSSSVGRRMAYQFQLNYAGKFGLHNVGAMGVFKREEYADGSEYKHFREDWVFRTTYDYDTRYLLEMNGAYNGSEQFGLGYRFDFFPSLALGWYVSNEKFFKIDWMNRLKIRYSTGLVGDDQAGKGRWLYLSQYASGGYARLNAAPNGSSPYTWYKETSVGNPDIHWENARKNDLGVEMGFLNDLIALNFDYFTEKRWDILLTGAERSIPPFFGAVPPVANIGRVNSNGYEIELKINKRFRGDYRLWANIAYSHNENKIIYKDDPYYKAAYLKKEGYSINQMTTQVRTGFYNNWDEVYASVPTETNDNQKLPGYYNLLDFNGDGVINSNDVVPYGYSGVPQNTCNLTLGFDYKQFSIMAQLYGVTNASRSVPMTNFMIQEDVVFSHVADYWSKDNQDATSFLPRWRTSGQNIGDYYLYDASYLRLKTVELAYTFDKKQIWLKKAGLSSLRIFINGNNLFFWSDLPDDRESNLYGGSASNGTYPTVKRINFGIDMNF